MQIIPAIDIKNGKCVRLTQGDFTREKIYSDDPVAIAKRWGKQGAKTLHVVDLDGAKNGNMENFETIKQIVKKVSIPVQVGGGIRNKRTVEKLLKIGVARVVLGTVALDDEEELKKTLEHFPTQIAVALDSKDGKLMKNGWVENSNEDIISVAKRLEKLGVKLFIYTDILKDGTLTKPNYDAIRNLIKNISVSLTVSGGISSVGQIRKLKNLKVEGIILGKALYEGKINFKEASYAS
jgi:phosphoribosylformimino-5-aminoimidazole carboxamide ribotide isomerase